MKRIALITCIAALLAAPAIAQVNLTSYVALGDSLTAGFASGGLMDYYQLRSFPAILAEQGGTAVFEMPLIAPPGLAPVLELKSLSPLVIDTTDVLPPMEPTDYFYNVELMAQYQNLAVPGSNTYDMLFTTGNIFNLLAGNQDNVMHDLILRTEALEDPANPGVFIDYTALVGAISQQPSFVTVWIGSNDYLGAVLAATPVDGVTMTPLAAFEQYMGNIIGGLATGLPNAQIVVLNLFGDARWVPFASSIPNSVDVPGLGAVTLMGEDGELTAGDRLTLAASELIAQGFGLPGGPPLPENLDLATGAPGVILREAELDAIADRAAAFNAIIDGSAAMFPNVHVFDINPVMSALAGGTYRSFGGIELTSELLIGGIYSYDGIHPQNIGHGVVAYELIEFLNDELGAGLEQISLYDVLTEGDWQGASPLGYGCSTCGAKNAQLTREAFLQVYRIFAPDLARRWDRHRRVDPATTVAID